MKKYRLFVIGIFSFFLICEPAFAVVKIVAKRPDFTVKYENSGDQVSGGLLIGNSLLLSSTIENPSSGLASAQLSSYGLDGTKEWDLPIKTESVAGPMTRDTTGNIYLLGAISTSSQPTQQSASQPVTINPDNVQIDPVITPTNTLNTLSIWKISNTGNLLQTYPLPMTEGVIPDSISYSNSGILVGAFLSKKYFQVSMDENGGFSSPIYLKAPRNIDLAQDFKYGKEKLKFLPTAKSLIGIPTWKPKKPTPVLIQYSKLGSKRAVNSFEGTPLFVFYKSSIGVIVGSESPLGFGISIVKPLN